MKLTNDYVQSIKKVNFHIERLLDPIDYYPDNIYINEDDPDQLFILDQCKDILNLLGEIYSLIDYFSEPVIEEGLLFKNVNGRYMLSERFNYAFTSGSRAEVLIYDDWDEKEKWVPTRVEHNNGDYYLNDLKNIPMDGLRARRR